MEYTFSAAADFEKLEQAIAGLYGAGAAGRQTARYRSLLQGLEQSFGPCEKLAVFSAPGRSEIGGNHTDHQHGLVLAGSIDLDVIAAVAPNGERVIRIQSEGFPWTWWSWTTWRCGRRSATPLRLFSGALPPGLPGRAAGWRGSTPTPPPAFSRAAA